MVDAATTEAERQAKERKTQNHQAQAAGNKSEGIDPTTLKVCRQHLSQLRIAYKPLRVLDTKNARWRYSCVYH